MTAFSAVDTAVESIRQGAYHYLTKPFKAEELVLFFAAPSKNRKFAVRPPSSNAPCANVSPWNASWATAPP